MNDEIVRLSLNRIAMLFGVEASKVGMENRFGAELEVSRDFMSENEVDDILFDIYFVADENIIKQLDSGEISIQTVEDYCRHMDRCYLTKPNLVIKTLV